MSDLFRLSLSKTKCFNQCKKQYEFNYILKFPKKTRDYHVTGTFCHKVLEDFHQEYIKGCLLPYNIVMGDVYKKAIKKYEKDMTPEMKKECWDFVDKYLKKISLDKKNGKPFNVLAVEKGFELPIGQDKNIILNGSIDRIQLDPDGVINVADYKTTKNKKYLMEDNFQLLTYAFIILNDDPTIEKIRGSYILIRHDFEEITTEFDRDEVFAIKEKYEDYAAKIFAEKDFTPNPTILCEYCDFLQHCDVGQKQARKFNGEVDWD